MEKLQEKAHFLKHELVSRLQHIDPATQQLWGKMNMQQMVEHLCEYVGMAAGNPPMTLLTPEERMPAMTTFLQSEKPFRENTPNVLMPDTPPPVKHSNTAHALEQLQAEIDLFFKTYEHEPEKMVMNPFFGNLDFDHSVQLLYKHATHHLRQFGG